MIKKKKEKGYKSVSVKQITSSNLARMKAPKPKKDKVCQEGKILNPKTGRCIKDRTANIKSKPQLLDSLPQPQPQKRFKIKRTKKLNQSGEPNAKQLAPAPIKQCPDDKVVNPATGRCVKAPKAKNTIKQCPDGKVVNPATGRCVKAKISKKQNILVNNKTKNPVKQLKTKKETTLEQIKVTQTEPKVSNRVAVYDVKSQGVMLAHTYKDPHTGKVKNPPKGFPKAPVGWYLSEKFDGYRAIWDGAEFRSRTGNVFATPEWFKDWLPNGIALDGELFLGRECFEKCGIFRKKVPDDKEWRESNVTYQIFDAPTIDKPFEQRQEEIKKIINQLCSSKQGKCPLILTKQTKVTSEEQVYKGFDTLVSKGAEGVMLRSPGSPYDAKRTAHLLKVKPFRCGM